MASKRTPCVVGAPWIYHYSTNVASTCHTRVAHFVSLTHLLQLPYSSSRCRLFLLLLALHIVQAHISVYVCAQYDALTPRPLDERNNVYAPPQDQLFMVLTVTKLRSTYDTTAIQQFTCPCIDICSDYSNRRTIRVSGPRSEIPTLVLITIIMSGVREISIHQRPIRTEYLTNNRQPKRRTHTLPWTSRKGREPFHRVRLA